jgi:hypothetical protein
MNYNNWSQKIHGLAKEKGWFDGKPRSEAEIMQLVVSEICEATEEVRNSRPAVYVDNNGVCEIGELDFISFIKLDGTDDPMNPKKSYMKPEGEAVEIADALIRILDYSAFKGLDVSSLVGRRLEEFGSVDDGPRELTALESHFNMVKILTQPNSLENIVSDFLIDVEYYFTEKGWDLEKVVSIKHQYNTTRPYRHGGKAL